MNCSLKYLRYATATAVSLIAISTANQAYAQCTPAPTAGDDTITCIGVTTGRTTIDQGGDDTITVDNGAMLTADADFALFVRDADGVTTLNNNGIISATGNLGNRDAVFFTSPESTADLVINNMSTGEIRNDSTFNFSASTAIQVAGGSINTFTLNNSGLISSTRQAIVLPPNAGFYNTATITNQEGGTIETIGSNNIAINLGAGVDEITNESGATIEGEIRLGDADDLITNNGAIMGDIDAGDGDDRYILDLDAGATYTGLADGGDHIAGDRLEIISTDNFSDDFSRFTRWETLALTEQGDLTITGDDTGFDDIELSNDAGVNFGAGTTWSVDITGQGGSNIINVDGDLTGDIDLGAGNDALTIDFDTGSYTGNANGGADTAGDALTFISNGDSNIDLDNFINFEDLTFGGSGEFTTINGSDIAADNVNLLTDVDLVLGNGSNITTTGSFVTAGGIAGGNTVTIGADAVLDVATFVAPENLVFDIASETSHSLLNVRSGAVDLGTGTTVSALISGGIPENVQVLVATGNSQVIGFDGGFGQEFEEIESTSLFFDFGIASGDDGAVTSSIDPNSLFITTNRIASIRDVIEEGNEANVGEVLNTLEMIPPGINDPQIQLVLGQVNSAIDAEELTEVLQATLPVLDTGSFSAVQNVTGNTLRLVSDRLTVIRDHGGSASGIASGDITENLQIWGQVFGQAINQDERQGISGFDAHTRGTTIGVDTEVLGDNVTAGIAFSYANTDVDSRNVNNSEIDVDSFNVSLYGDYDLTENTYIVGDIGYTYSDNEGQRFNIGGVSGLNAESDYGSHQGEARIILGHEYQPEAIKDVRIVPKIQAHYIHFQNEDINETGAGGAGLNIDSESLNILEFGVGVDVRKDYLQEDGGLISPEISLGYRYDVIGDAINTTSTFSAGGPSFISGGSDPAQSTFNVGAGVGYTAPDGKEFTFSYDYEGRDEFNSHSALFRIAAPF